MSECIGYLRALSSSVEPPPLPNDVCVELLSSEDSLVDGVQCKVSKYVVDDSAHRFDGLKCSDFALENLQAAGVDLRMQFCRPSSLSAVDSLEYEAFRMYDYASRARKASEVSPSEPSKNE